MTEPETFTRTVLEREQAAADAMYIGNPEPFIQLWSQQDPVSLFGAFGPCRTGWPDLARTFRWVGSRYSEGAVTLTMETSYVGTDLAYTVGYEQGDLLIDGVR